MDKNYQEILDQLFKTDPEILRTRLRDLEIERKILLSVLEKDNISLKSQSSPSYESPVETYADSSEDNEILGEAVLTDADLSYNNLRFKIKSNIAKNLPTNGTVKIVYKDISIEGTIPPSVRGRINGVHLYKKFPDLFKVGSKLNVKYSKADRTLSVVSIEN
ncbi:hypothetical protein [Paenibacillus sp. HGF5]|uniref:hypothetical protein n=1 Tax=Paenibacillus sp. HGF5 TaxID=908341 RepID=UPI0002072063|nr:hypothetical protein [Paenibacillus sp. HGF5]EGG33785.1 hypothetical protein HMPREF9412_3687 [Paenibacillus sp. HGF5]